MKSHFFVAAVFGLAQVALLSSSSAGIITAWDFDPLTGGANNFGVSPLSATQADANVSVVGLTRGSGVGTTGTGAGNAWGGNAMQAANATAAATGNDFFSFSVTANAGQTVSFSDVAAYNIRRSASGPTTGLWQYQVGGGGWNSIGGNITWGAVTSSAGNAQSAITLSGIGALQNVGSGIAVDFRVLMFGGTASAGTGYLNDPSGSSGNDFIVNGTISAVPEPTSMALLGVTGVVGAVGARFRKKAKAK